MNKAGVTSGNGGDAEVLAGLFEHDEEALLQLIESCGAFVYAKALQILHQPPLAEEVTQDTLLVLWWEPERFDISRGTLRSFLIGTARFKAIDVVRRQEVQRSKETLLNETDSFFAEDSAAESIEEEIVLRSAISDLPKAKREVIFLAFYRGLTYREVAQALDLPEGTVKTRIRDALVRLSTALRSAQVVGGSLPRDAGP